MAEPIRLNLGGGDIDLPGFTTVDRKRGGEVYPLAVPGITGNETTAEAIPDNSVDEIYASHVLEHFSHRQTLDVLKEWVRALKPGGTLKVAVPNFDYIVDRYVGGNTTLPLEGFVFGGHIDENDRHGAMFNADKLRTLLSLAGLGDIQPWTSSLSDCASLPVSLNLQGTKGAPEYPNLRGKVAAVFSVPRFGPLDTMFCSMEAFTKLNIPAIRKSGVFWHQALTGAIEVQLQTKPTYILCLDYDSLFTVDDVVGLYRLMEAHPEADAVCAVQCGRDRATALMTVTGEDGKNRATLSTDEMAKDVLELRTGHFGCTLIRATAFDKLERPWMNAIPDKDGSWGEGRVDSDIQFWLNFRKQGLRLFQANRVVIGHGQWMATFPDQNLESRHLYVSEYLATGKPEWAWR